MYAELRGNNQGLIKLISGALKPNAEATRITDTSNKKISAKVLSDITPIASIAVS